jgi:hypothetical protein
VIDSGRRNLHPRRSKPQMKVACARPAWSPLRGVARISLF